MGVNLPMAIGTTIDEKMARPLDEVIRFAVVDWVLDGDYYTCTKQLSKYNPLSNVIVELIDTSREVRKEEQALNVQFSMSDDNVVTATTWRLPTFDFTYRFLIDIEETEFNAAIIQRIINLEESIKSGNIQINQATSVSLGGIKADPATEDDTVPVHITNDGKLVVTQIAEDGATFTPSVSEEGVLSWTNDKKLANPDPMNIKGDKGESGDDGIGITSVEQTIISTEDEGENITTITLSNGTTTEIRIRNGSHGSGEKGEQGEKGQSIDYTTREYYLSSSKTEQTGGEWSATPPTWEVGKYMWERLAITYKDPVEVEYTTPTVDTYWEFIFARFM